MSEDDFMKDLRNIPERVYFSGVEVTAIEARASAVGLSKSGYIRRLVLLDLERDNRERLCRDRGLDHRTMMDLD